MRLTHRYAEQIGRYRAVGKASGAETLTPVALVTEIKNGKTTSVRGYLDPKKGLKAAAATRGAPSATPPRG